MGFTASQFGVNSSNSTPQDIASLNLALAYLSQSSVAVTILQGMVNNNTTIVMQDYSNLDNTIGGGGPNPVINWDPTSAMGVISSTGVVGVQSAAIGLIHEGAHADDDVNVGSAAREAYATEVETSVADQLGEPTRGSYTMVEPDFTTELNPTEHSAVLVNGQDTSWQEYESNGTTTTGGIYTPSSPSLPPPASAPVIGGTVTASNRPITIASGSTATINGSNDSIDLGTFSSVTTSGTSISLTCGINTVAGISGAESALCSGGSFTITGNNVTGEVTAGSTISVTGTGDIITMDSGSSVSFTSGGDNTVICGGVSQVVTGGADLSCSGGVLMNMSTDAPYDGDDGDDGYSYGGYGFAGKKPTISTALGDNANIIAQYDFSNWKNSSAAEAALNEADEVANETPQAAGAAAVVLENAKWNQNVITWCLTTSDPYDSATAAGSNINSYESSVQQAFATWAVAMPGVTFEQVADSSQADIKVGLGNLDTASTGVVGYTGYNESNGQFLPGVLVTVEDPSLDPSVAGTQSYGGTSATLVQALVHEIGHALGLADNADPNSIMNYQLSSSNATPDLTDLEGIAEIYGFPAGLSAASATAGNSSVAQLIQAMASFNPDVSATDTSTASIFQPVARTMSVAANLQIMHS